MASGARTRRSEWESFDCERRSSSVLFNGPRALADTEQPLAVLQVFRLSA